MVDNVPNNASELRRIAVSHISKGSNFDRFKDTILVNLQNRFPGHNIGTDSSTEIIKTAYTAQMSSDGEYGTMAELCALSEIFRFAFYVIRQSNDTEFVCYDYGSTLDQQISTLDKICDASASCRCFIFL